MGRGIPNDIENELDVLSHAHGGETRYYWMRHRPRYQFVFELLRECDAQRPFGAILDVGMAFETLMLSRSFPHARVDCLGFVEDQRFRPARASTFYRFDLNDVIAPEKWPVCERRYDLIVFMEVLEHLYTPADEVFRFLASLLHDGGLLLVTTPNGAWLKNRIKAVRGQNPFNGLRADRSRMGHVREYTRDELETAFRAVPLRQRMLTTKGLYDFDNRKDNLYSHFADLTWPALRRTLVALYEKPPPAAGRPPAATAVAPQA